MRVVALACIAGLLAACGGGSSPVAPAGPSAPSLREGTYELRFSPGASAPGGQAYVGCLSIAAGGAAPDPQASLFMKLTRSGDGWELRMPNPDGAGSGDLVVRLAPSTVPSITYPAGSVVSGTARGTAVDERGRGIRISSGDGAGDALLVGAAGESWGHGDLTGTVSISAGGASVSCSPVNWALTRR